MLYDRTTLIIELVVQEAHALGMRLEDFRKSHNSDVVKAKRRLAWHARIERGLPYLVCARLLRCDHTTVRHHVEKYRSTTYHESLPTRLPAGTVSPSTQSPT